MIDEKETFKRFGYRSTDLKPQSNKRIIAICDKCGEIREISQSQYRNLCHHCAIRTEERSIKISKGNEGKKISEIVKKRLSKIMGGTNNPMYGKHHTEKSKQKIRKNRPDTSGENNPNWRGGKIRRICEICGIEFEVNQSKINNGGGRFHSRSCARKAKKIPTHHTKPELIFEAICKRNNLDFHYVGDGQLWIGKKHEKQLNPDFIEANGKKICIEIFGAYWHSPLLNQNIKEARTLEYRKKFYRKYKWQPIFIWDTDLVRKDAEQFVLNTLQKEGVI